MRLTRHSLKQGLSPLSATLLMLACLGIEAEPLQVVTEDSSYSALRDGKVVGSASEVVEKVLSRAGVSDYRMALYPWARAYDIARLESNVMIYPIVRSSERESLFIWVGELESATPKFYKLHDRHDIVINDLGDARNFTVGVIRDDARQEYLKEQGFSKMVVSANNLDNLRKLLNGQVALVPMPEREARVQCAQLHIDFGQLESVYTVDELSSELYVALSLKTPPDTVQRITTAFTQLKEDGTVANAMAQ
ncbi:ABC transporter substrate-binding protein [Pseudomonas sp. LP_7_YM]|uniref:substrate-binding periplasmic protein n=1 Tax=Pseudomonas sp. LP_7_YM TaxID=2485137 RepID=UPI0010CF2038|nr:transporter substrate-binding domain-containing protein [Pseudomonas sp. LP_7_YM]TDV67744.1 amino acid ABC transporter substrate-binding protein (PAAT family) [Pseudomonas sp. LP_7_YM]